MRTASLLTAALALTIGCVDPTPNTDGAGKADPVDPDDPAAHEVPSEGTTETGLEAVDDAIKAWMRATCTGAVTFALGFHGETIVSRGYGYKSGPPNPICGKPGDEFSGVGAVTPDTPMRLGSNSKAITAAITRIVLQQKLASLGRPTTDAEVESLLVFDPDLDLVSPNLRRVVQANAAAAPVTCPTGQSGTPVIPGGKVDPRWQTMTVGHLLGHRSGLPRDVNMVASKLAAIRGISSLGELEQEAELAGAGQAVRESLAKAVPNAHFLRPQTLEEYIIGNTDVCLNFSPGGPLPTIPEDFDPYSNIGFGLLQHIAEHVSGRSLGAPLGEADAHPETLLAQFSETRLGITIGSSSKYGIYAAQPILGVRDVAEPSYRAWDGTTLQGTGPDLKRPYCVWNEAAKTCDATPFLTGTVRYHWKWINEPVPVGYENERILPGAGLLVAEAPLMLKFLAKYWVSGGGATPYYGRERATNPSTATHAHLGALRGTDSTVAQFMGDVIDYYAVPRKDGELDLATFQALELKPADALKCVLPKGLDMVLTANQHDDQVCATDGQDACNRRYMALRDVVKEALCKVSWMKVNPQLTSN